MEEYLKLIDETGMATIPDDMTEISEGAFAGCSELTGIVIPDSVTEIGDEAFIACSGLKNVKIPNCVELGKGVFSECKNLRLESY